MALNSSPIIIKKVKKSGHGHHGGAWKVAYADFVTAMMAFFLLLWLLSATPAENLKGLADYFSPTMGLVDRAGIGFQGGTGPSSEGVSADVWASQGLVFGSPPSGPRIIEKSEGRASGDGGSKEAAELFSLIEADIQKAIKEDERLYGLKDAIDFAVKPEGMQIQIRDKAGQAMFANGQAVLTSNMKKVVAIVTERIRYLPNYIAITGHTNSLKFPGYNPDYSNWELSVDRANAVRRFMISIGLDVEQVAKVVGKADYDPIDWEKPDAVENRRIAIVLLNKAVVPTNKKPVPDVVIDKPGQEGIKEYLTIIPNEDVPEASEWGEGVRPLPGIDREF